MYSTLFTAALAVSATAAAASSCAISENSDYFGGDHVTLAQGAANSPQQCCDICCGILKAGDLTAKPDSWTFTGYCICKVLAQAKLQDHPGYTSGTCVAVHENTTLV